MNLQEQNILFFTRAMGIGGTEKVVLQLCEVFKPLVNKIIVCSCGGCNEDILKKMNIKHYKIPDISKKSFLNFLCIQKKLNYIISKENISVIHTHHRMAAFYCHFLKLNRQILINTSHTAFYDKKYLTRFSFKKFNLIACGKDVKDSLVQFFGVNQNKITIIYNGIKSVIPSSVNVPKEIIQAKANCYHLIAFVGRISKEKGLDVLVEAVSLLNDPNLKVVVVGQGPDYDNISKKLINKHLENSFIFLGYRDDVINIISQVDFVVQPSYQEGFPLTPIESFSIGKSVIGTNVSGTREIISDRKNGLIVSSGDPLNLSKAIDFFLHIDRSNFEKEALSTYKKKYSFEVFASSYVKYYKSLKV